MYKIYLRMISYVITIVMHVGNAAWMATSFQGEVMKNHYVKHFSEMQCFFFTCWSFTFQIAYAALSLYCDVKLLKNRSNRLKKLNDFRDAFFSILVWPSSMLVFVAFWAFFMYDRSLIYPKDIDMAISSTSNHIMHTSIVFITLWEMLFRPRTPPFSHKWHILLLVGLQIIYLSTVHGIFVLYGVWIYPVFRLISGSIYIYSIFLASVTTLLVILYYTQWILNDLLWDIQYYKTSSKKTGKGLRYGVKKIE